MIYEVKQAIANKIKEVYPNATIYDEDIPQGFKDGSFLISVIDGTYKKSIDNRFSGSVSFDIAYFPESSDTLKNECYQVAQNMLRAFDLLNNSHRTNDKNFNITDDVLHILFTVKYREIKTEIGVKMSNIHFAHYE